MLERIISKDNHRIKEAAKLLKSRREREEQGRFLVEGARIIRDALDGGALPQEAYFTDQALEKHGDLLELLLDMGVPCAQITQAVGEKLSDTRTPQGIFCVFKKVDILRNSVNIKKDGRYLLLSGLQDPGNVGTILRTAEAFGLDGILYSKDCPDLFGPKLLRSTMGGVFRIPLMECENMVQTIAHLKELGVRVYATALSEEALPIQQADWSAPCAAVIGNEGNGLDPQVIRACSGCVMIPMRGQVQSLNAAVAASIVLWEMYR